MQAALPSGDTSVQSMSPQLHTNLIPLAASHGAASRPTHCPLVAGWIVSG